MRELPVKEDEEEGKKWRFCWTNWSHLLNVRTVQRSCCPDVLKKMGA